MWVITALVKGPKPIDATCSLPPFWLVPIPFVFFAVFLPGYLSLFEKTVRYTKESPWPASPLSPFGDPLPFYHFGGWVCVVTAIPELVHALTPYDRVQLHFGVMMLSFGVGGLIGVWIGRRRLLKKVK
jgi:hypothetical protein